MFSYEFSNYFQAIISRNNIGCFFIRIGITSGYFIQCSIGVSTEKITIEIQKFKDNRTLLFFRTVFSEKRLQINPHWLSSPFPILWMTLRILMIDTKKSDTQILDISFIHPYQYPYAYPYPFNTISQHRISQKYFHKIQLKKIRD